MDTIKDRNSRDLVGLLKRSIRDGKNTWKNYTKKKDLFELDYYDGVVSHPKPDILE